MAILSGPDLTDTFRSILHALEHWAVTTPDDLALTFEDITETYRQLAQQARNAAVGLAAQGVQPGDRVVLVGDNTPHWVHTYLGALRLGAIACPANTRLSPTQFADQATLLDAWAIATDDRHDDLASNCRPERRLAPAASAVTSAWTGDTLPPLDDVVTPDRAALVSFTSGTTAIPKGATLSHRALVHASTVFAQVLGTGRATSTLIVVPLFHNTGFVDQLGHMLIVGGRTDLLRRYRTADAIAAARRRPATFVTAVPSIVRMLMLDDDADASFGPARDLLYGGSPMPAAWTRELVTRWPRLRLHHGYGLTEFGSACSFLPPQLATAHGESIGMPAPGVQLRVVSNFDVAHVEDAIDIEQDDDQGEIWVAGPTRMLGYWQLPDADVEKLRGPWLRTGDLATMRDGLLYISGRIDEVINRGGEKILPSFVESHLADLPGIAQACVFGLPDPVLQYRVVAAVEPRPDAHFDVAAAQTQLLEQLPDYAVPEQFIVVPHLPRTASGKLDRRAISQAYVHHIEETS